MTEAGDAIKAAMQRHQASIAAASETASALAAERDKRTAEAAGRLEEGRPAVFTPQDDVA